MSGFSSTLRDAVSKATATFASVTVAERGPSGFIDPGMTGKTRFMQKSGFPLPVLTPLASGPLVQPASAGNTSAVLQGTSLIPWLEAGMTVALELTETLTVESVAQTVTGGNTLVTFTAPVLARHDAGTLLHLQTFRLIPTDTYDADTGTLATGALEFTSSFLLVVGDTVVCPSGQELVVSTVEQSSFTSGTYTWQVTFEDALPEVLTSGLFLQVKVRPAYQSQVLAVPSAADLNAVARGPFAVDVVSGPLVTDYHPEPECVLYLEEFTVDSRVIAASHLVEKNDTVSRVPIERDQFLFWNVMDGGLNFNGPAVELRAFDSGLVGIWSPLRPGLDTTPLSFRRTVVPLFSPYRVILPSGLVDGSVEVLLSEDRSLVDSSLYTVDDTTGNVDFDSTLQGQEVLLAFQQRLSWQFRVIPSEADLVMCVKMGTDDAQQFSLGAPGIPQTLTVTAGEQASIDFMSVTCRREDVSEGAFTVQMSDWQPNQGTVARLRYTIVTGADQTNNWAASGLLLKPIFPSLALLRARLDQPGAFATLLDAGRILS